MRGLTRPMSRLLLSLPVLNTSTSLRTNSAEGSKQHNFFCRAVVMVCRTSSIKKSTVSFSSFPRRREGGFTFQVQQFLAENLCGGFVVKTLSRSMIIGAHQTEQTVIG